MENKINIAELLKDCPLGIELDCTMYDKVTFDEVTTVIGFDDKKRVKIILSTHYSDGTKDEINLTEFGTYTDDETAKCVIFPKGKTTWEGFHRPFVKGDIVATESGMFIGMVKSTKDNRHCDTFCTINDRRHFFIDNNFLFSRLATEEEKQKLFKAINDNGYKWNAETKTLEKLIEPKFKVGDRVKHISAYASGIVVKVTDKGYYIDYPKGEGICYISFELEKDYELAPNKFDITTLKPFDKVLVRDFDNETWEINFFSRLLDGKHFKCLDLSYVQCIPYEGNEHLLGTTNNCDEFYKTW